MRKRHNEPGVTFSRRHFILAAVGIAGACMVGWGVLPPRQRRNGSTSLPVEHGQIALNGWVAIAPDGQVTVVVAKNEMGQGVESALPMLVAEELDVPLAMVSIRQAPIDKIYGDISILPDALPFHPDDHSALKRTAQWLSKKAAREFGVMVTGGSSSIKDSWLPMREAGAAARAMLLNAAAKSWNVPLAQCHTDAGFVVHASGKRLGYGDLASAAATHESIQFQLRDVREFKLIGTSPVRRDSPAKVNGSALFGMDVRLPGMVYAAVRMCPEFGGTLQSFDAEAVASLPGVLQVVALKDQSRGAPSAVAVIARSWWQARQAVAKLPVKWVSGHSAGTAQPARPDSAAIHARFKQYLDEDSGFTYYASGDVVAGSAKQTLRAEYSAPFLAHAALEPINCTAQFSNGKLSVWMPTQVPSIAVSAAAKAAGIAQKDVTLHTTYLGGGFGRRLETDMVVQAVELALVTEGAPVQLIWSREEDMAHDFYRPAALARFRADLDDQGEVIAWQSQSVSGSVSQKMMGRAFGLPEMGPDKTTAEGLYDLCYEFPHQRIRHVIAESAVPLGSWRSVGHSHNAFFKESFIDEIAHATGKDAVDFRRGLLKNHPRHLTVLNAAVAKAGTAPSGRAHGVALHQSFGSIAAQVAEVSIEGQQIRVHKIWCAIDCGLVVNPDGVRQQIESAIIFGLSAALFGEITVANGGVMQKNFHDYRLVRMNQSPEIETILIASSDTPEGVGEPGTPPVAPAVANAVFILTGKRLRSLPLRLA